MICLFITGHIQPTKSFMSQSQNPLTQTPAPALDWSRDEAPASSEFGDIYFSVDGGLEETNEVFLKGCQLPEKWETRDVFVIGELGFGSGLNFLTVWDKWRQTAGKDARLHFISIEAFPWQAEDLKRALCKFPSLKPLADQLIAQWPGRVKGVHRLHFDNVYLTLYHMQAERALAAMDACVDAWFLDGFSPSKNPDMWTQSIFDKLAKRSRPGATLATFTVAGAVRRSLEQAGFDVSKQPGFGRKRERLQASIKGISNIVEPSKPTHAPIIIGSGIAGASLARAFQRRGVNPTIIDPDPGLQSAASGNPAALVMPRLDLQDRPESRFFLSAFQYATREYAQTAFVTQTGALHLAKSEDEFKRFEKLAHQSPLPSAEMQLVSKDQAAEYLQINHAHPFGGLYFPHAQTINPKAVINAWTKDAQMIDACVAKIEKSDLGWACLNNRDEIIAVAEAVFVTAGAEVLALNVTDELPVRFTRGQISWHGDVPAPACPVTFGGYAMAYEDGVLLGATHDHVGPGQTDETNADDDSQNRLLYETMIGDQLPPSDWQSRASVRVTTKDTLPISNQLLEGLFVMSGLGARGFMMAPLLGEALVCEALDEPAPLCLETKMRFGARENI
jgi:tRNA 5-methylaminomethyl-2-thiouridine biosynthesis bifunctional protein